MTEKTGSVTQRRRKRTVLVPLLVVGVAAWAVRRRLDEPQTLDGGWQPLPPAPRPVPAVPERAAAPEQAVALPEPVVAEPVTAEPAAAEPVAAEPVSAASVAPEPVAAAAPADHRSRAVPTAVASVASVATPARPAVPGALPALADGSSPDPAYTVKGKVATKVFHVPGGAYYTRTRADVWFRSAPAARAAGFTQRVRQQP
jgi:hypothetical protein